MARTARSSLICIAAALLALVFAGPAAASSGVSVDQVRSELQKASDALDLIWGDDSSDDLGDDTGDDSGVNLTAVADNLEHTAAARQLAQKVKKGKSRVTALIAVTDQADDNVFEYADDIGWVDPDQQPTFVDALSQSLGVRGSAVSALIATAPKQKESVRDKLSRTIGDDLSDGDPEVLLDTLAEEDGYGATFAVKDTVAPILAKLINDTKDVARDLTGFGDAADELNGEIDGLPDYVDELFDDFADYDDPAAGQAAFCGYLAQEPLPKPDACG